MSAVKMGWGFPGRSRKAHFFCDGTALCGKWAFFGELETGAPKFGEKPGPDDCAACWRKAKAHFTPSAPLDPQGGGK